MAIIKKIPSGEHLKVTCKGGAGGFDYVITQKIGTNSFTLYKCVDGGYEKLDKVRNNPLEFDEIVWKKKK